jgi:hypothetical protein
VAQQGTCLLFRVHCFFFSPHTLTTHARTHHFLAALVMSVLSTRAPQARDTRRLGVILSAQDQCLSAVALFPEPMLSAPSSSTSASTSACTAMPSSCSPSAWRTELWCYRLGEHARSRSTLFSQRTELSYHVVAPLPPEMLSTLVRSSSDSELWRQRRNSAERGGQDAVRVLASTQVWNCCGSSPLSTLLLFASVVCTSSESPHRMDTSGPHAREGRHVPAELCLRVDLCELSTYTSSPVSAVCRSAVTAEGLGAQENLPAAHDVQGSLRLVASSMLHGVSGDLFAVLAELGSWWAVHRVPAVVRSFCVELLCRTKLSRTLKRNSLKLSDSLSVPHSSFVTHSLAHLVSLFSFFSLS